MWRGLLRMWRDCAGAVMTKLVASDHLQTPDYILERVRALGQIALDPCGNQQSRMRVLADAEFTLDDGRNGLVEQWGSHCLFGLAFVNPPYGHGHLGPWTTKITSEAVNGCEVVSLLPLDPTTKWWKRMTSTAQARVMIDHRVQFIGGSHKSGSIKSALFYHGTRPHLFLHHCGGLGEGVRL